MAIRGGTSARAQPKLVGTEKTTAGRRPTKLLGGLVIGSALSLAPCSAGSIWQFRAQRAKLATSACPWQMLK